MKKSLPLEVVHEKDYIESSFHFEKARISKHGSLPGHENRVLAFDFGQRVRVFQSELSEI